MVLWWAQAQERGNVEYGVKFSVQNVFCALEFLVRAMSRRRKWRGAVLCAGAEQTQERCMQCRREFTECVLTHYYLLLLRKHLPAHCGDGCGEFDTRQGVAANGHASVAIDGVA